MARLARKRYKLFGETGPTDDFEKFGSAVTGSPVKTKDIDTIQSLATWASGFKNAIVTANRAPYLEDVNALEYVHGYMLSYLMQEGIPEWETATTYHIGSIVKKPSAVELYISKTNDNTGNALPSLADNTQWALFYPVPTTKLSGVIESAQINSGAVTYGKLATASVSDGNIIAMATSKLTGTIATSQIADASVTAAKLASDISGAVLNNGWVVSPHTFAYNSTVSFKITGADVTSLYRPGMRIKFVQSGTTRYFVVISSAMVSTDTVVTVFGNSAGVVNSAITSPYVSIQGRPSGFPAFFSCEGVYAFTTSGWSSVQGDSTAIVFISESGMIRVKYYIIGTSNSNTTVVTFPFVIDYMASGAEVKGIQSCWTGDGSGSYVGGIVATGSVAPYGSGFNIYKSAGANWTASGNKSVSGVLIGSLQ